MLLIKSNVFRFVRHALHANNRQDISVVLDMTP